MQCRPHQLLTLFFRPRRIETVPVGIFLEEPAVDPMDAFLQRRAFQSIFRGPTSHALKAYGKRGQKVEGPIRLYKIFVQ